MVATTSRVTLINLGNHFSETHINRSKIPITPKLFPPDRTPCSGPSEKKDNVLVVPCCSPGSILKMVVNLLDEDRPQLKQWWFGNQPNKNGGLVDFQGTCVVSCCSIMFEEFLQLCQDSSRLVGFVFLLTNYKNIVGDFSWTQTPTEIRCGGGKIGKKGWKFLASLLPIIF